MKRIVVTLYRKRESLKVKLSNNLLVAVLQAMLAVCRGIKMKKKSLKAVGTVLAVCLCATACGSTASTTTEDNTVNSETKEASTEQASVVQSQETAEVPQDAKEASVDNFTVTYLDDGTVMLSDYTGDGEVIQVPGEVNGKTVTVIGENTFINHTELETVELPDSIVEIKKQAFMNCYNLQHVKLGNSLLTIGESVFSFTNLQELNLPDSLQEMGITAFSGNNYKSVIIPSVLYH